MPNTSTLYLGSDHAGFAYKAKLKRFLDELNIPYEDLGNTTLDPSDDYPDYAAKVAKKVQENGNNRGILICNSGIGTCIAANRFKNVRAVNAASPKQAEQARHDNNANVLCLGASVVPFWIARKIVKSWLSTKFDIAARHRRRVSQLDNL
ncbi:MAG: RpiB/LacA/LacB family sugar-phosphate isomerase [Thermoleophilia bacterium]